MQFSLWRFSVSYFSDPRVLAIGQGNRVSNARLAVPAVIVLWNGALVVLAEKEFYHEATKFPMKSPGWALIVRFLRGFVVK